MKFILFVEGETERKSLPGFFKRWLDQRLTSPVGIKVVRFEGWAELVKDTPRKALMHLDGPGKNDIIAVISLLDLYGPTFYPAGKITAADRYEWAKQHLEGEVNHPGFHQFFAVHETEAWLLSNPSLFPAQVRSGLPGSIQSPEQVDFGEPPSKLLERIYGQKTKRSYKKVVNGRELFGRLDPDTACRKCPRLQELLDETLRLAQGAGL